MELYIPIPIKSSNIIIPAIIAIMEITTVDIMTS
jgi:hypothetical protein